MITKYVWMRLWFSRMFLSPLFILVNPFFENSQEYFEITFKYPLCKRTGFSDFKICLFLIWQLLEKILELFYATFIDFNARLLL